MRKLIIPLMGSAAVLSACAMEPAPVRPATAAEAAAACGTYGYVDVNNDGFITGDEWNTYRTSTYNFWDTNGDGRISREEFNTKLAQPAPQQAPSAAAGGTTPPPAPKTQE